MISDTARSHGSFFALLLDRIDQAVSIERLGDRGVGYYMIEGKIPLYLKTSTKRKGPWAFNFYRSHKENQEELYQKYGECFTCLICGQDGVVGLHMSELNQITNALISKQNCISVHRKLKNMYSVKGRNGELRNRISRRSIFDKLNQAVIQGKSI